MLNEQTSLGGRVQLSLGTAWSVSGNASQASANGSSIAVNEQSGLFAGDGGYHVNAGTVALKGGAIASTNAGQSELTTNAITFEHLTNKMEYKASSMSLSGSVDGSANAKADDDTNFSLPPSLPMQEKGGDSSTTYATLTDGKLTIGGKTMTGAAGLGAHTDAETATRAISQLPDLKTLMQDQQAMAAATGTVVATSSQIAGDIVANAQKEADLADNAAKEAAATIEAANQILQNPDSTEEQRAEAQRIGQNATARFEDATAARNAADEQARDWSPKGDYGRALNVVTGILVGGASGQGIGQLAAEASAPYVYKAVGDLAEGYTSQYTNARLAKLEAEALLDDETDPGKQAALEDKIAQADAVMRANQDQYDAWTEGGSSKIMMHALATAALARASGGNALDGAIAGGLNEAKGPLFQALTAGLDADVQKSIADWSSLTVGAIAGNSQIAGLTLSAEQNNRQLHDNEEKKLTQLLEGKSPPERQRLIDAACALTKCAEGLSDENPEKKDRLAQQQRGATYQKELATLKATNMFDYGAGYAMMDVGARVVDRGSLEVASAGRGASNLFGLITEQLSPNADLPSNSGGPGGPTAGAAVALPRYKCSAVGGIIEMNAAAMPGTYPANAMLSGWGSGDDGGEGRSRESADESRRRETSSDSDRGTASGNSGGNGEKPSAGASTGSEKLNNAEGAGSSSGAVGEGVIASRINVQTGAANVTGSGFEYAWKKHGGDWGPNKSAFTIPKDELKIILQDPSVVKTPAYKSPTSVNYIRIVDMGRPIGVDAKAGGQATSYITIITDAKGNLINAFPGKTR